MRAHCVRQAPRARRFGAVALIVAVLPTLAGASHRTANFMVEAPTREAAKAVAEHAEACRKSIAREWLGKELPAWRSPCPVTVKLTGGEAGGLTSFGFAEGRVSDQSMTVEGRLDRVLASAIPHEVTHTVFAAFFGGPMPRWADEGASLLSEDLRERQRHDQISLDLIARRGDLPLGRLFRDRRLSERPHGVLRSGLFDLALPGRDGRPAAIPPVRPGRAANRLGPGHQDALRPGRRPRARPGLAVVAQGRRGLGVSAGRPGGAGAVGRGMTGEERRSTADVADRRR